MNFAALLKPFSVAFSFVTRHPRIFAGGAAILLAGFLLWRAYNWAYDKGYDASTEKSNVAYLELVRDSMAKELAYKSALSKCRASIASLRTVALEEQVYRDRVIRGLEEELRNVPEPVLTPSEGGYNAKDLLRDVTRWGY